MNDIPYHYLGWRLSDIEKLQRAIPIIANCPINLEALFIKQFEEKNPRVKVLAAIAAQMEKAMDHFEQLAIESALLEDGMKVEDKRAAVEPKRIAAREIPVKTVFKGAIAGHQESTYLRHYGGIVNLENPTSNWTFQEKVGGQRDQWEFGEPEVVGYQPVHGRIVIERNA